MKAVRKTDVKYPFPEHTEIFQEVDSLRATFRIPESYSFFEGHFPGNPLVPAVIQIGWAVAAIALLKAEELDGYRLSRFKFIAPILPHDEVIVVVQAKKNKYLCLISANNELCSSGTLVLGSDV